MNLKNNCENKIFLEDLPKTNSGKIDWKNSINRKVRFLYDEIFDTIDILEYIPGREPRVVIKKQ
nr:MAG TPA: hypothetical protein [Caudoviricetes sp.]